MLIRQRYAAIYRDGVTTLVMYFDRKLWHAYIMHGEHVVLETRYAGSDRATTLNRARNAYTVACQQGRAF